MSTDLSDALHRAVAGAHPDLDRILPTARKRGLGIRRRRQALSAVGGVAVVGVLAAGGQLLVSSPSTPPPAARPTPQQKVTTAPPQPQRMTGRAVAAALRDAVQQQLPGSSSDTFKGQADNEAYAELRLHPGDGSGYSLVGINVQPGFTEGYIYTCGAKPQCRITHPERGATLMTYEERTPTVDGLGVRRVVDLLRADGVRVVASSANGEELAGNHWQVTRPDPALSVQQLHGIVSKPWFGPRMDPRFTREGAALPGYVELDSDIAG